MVGFVYRVDVDDRQVQAMLQRLIDAGQNMRPMMRDIATIGESSTRDRFKTQSGPDGQAWKPSQRAEQNGGKTLIQHGHLLDSVVSNSDADSAQWGEGVIYAAIHQFGGKAGRGHKSEIPARPSVGINADDEESILSVINRRLADAIGI